MNLMIVITYQIKKGKLRKCIFSEGCNKLVALCMKKQRSAWKRLVTQVIRVLPLLVT